MSGGKRPKYDRRRGRHKKRRSIETREWEAAHLPPVPPSWMSRDLAQRLTTLRRELDPLV